mgnify:CR=1 FL=1
MEETHSRSATSTGDGAASGRRGGRRTSSGTSSVGASRRSQQQRSKELVWKIIVVGDLATGKTSLIKRYVHDVFTSNYRATIGVDFAIKQIQMNSTMIRLQLWDIAGQERFGNMTRVFYRDAVAAVVVYDKLRPITFEAVSKWKEDIDSKLLQPNLPVILLANKCDLEGDRSAEEIEHEKKKLDELCERLNFCAWFNTSAKQNQGVESAINFLVENIMKAKAIDIEDPNVAEEPSKESAHVDLEETAGRKQEENVSKSKCC